VSSSPARASSGPASPALERDNPNKIAGVVRLFAARPRLPRRVAGAGARDLGFRVGTGVFALVLLLIVCAIGYELTRQSMESIQKFGLNFWRTDIWDPVAGEFGARPFIWGTLYSSMLALLISTPIALGISVFISELCPASLRQPLVFLTELLAAIPSIVYGLWGIFVLVPAVRALEASTPEALRALPLFSGPPLGVGMLAAALILAIMVIPFTSSVSREVLKAVPATQREAAYALGATKFEAIRAALFYARTGIVGAVMLGFGRALGETMAVTMVIGNTPRVAASLFAPQYTMAAVIANEFTEAATPLYLAALVEIGLVLFIITLIVNSLSRLLIWTMARNVSEAAVPEPTAEGAAA
jgi:phosphate transport system permease protein